MPIKVHGQQRVFEQWFRKGVIRVGVRLGVAARADRDHCLLFGEALGVTNR